jgi:hypothetical protein
MAPKQRRHLQLLCCRHRCGPSGPAVWFAQAEAQASLAGMSNERNKFNHIISQLDRRYAADAEDIVISPPQQDWIDCHQRESSKLTRLSRTTRWATVSRHSL